MAPDLTWHARARIGRRFIAAVLMKRHVGLLKRVVIDAPFAPTVAVKACAQHACDEQHTHTRAHT